MIVIPIELWPFGYADHARSLGQLRISNDGTGDSHRGNYDVRVYSAGPVLGKPIREARVEDWPRQSRPVQELILAALLAAGYNYRKQDVPNASP